MTEFVNGPGDLLEFLHRTPINDEEWIQIVFQALYTFAAIRQQSPGYRHCDSHLGNFLVERHAPKTVVYEYEGDRYKFVDTTFTIKLSDFDWSYEPVASENLKHNKEDRFGRCPSSNPVFDVHYFLNVLKNTDFECGNRITHRGLLRLYEDVFGGSSSPYEGEYNLLCQDYKLSCWGLVQKLFFEIALGSDGVVVPKLVDQRFSAVPDQINRLYRIYRRRRLAYTSVRSRRRYGELRRTAWALSKEIVNERRLLRHLFQNYFKPAQRAHFLHNPLFRVEMLDTNAYEPSGFPTVENMLRRTCLFRPYIIVTSKIQETEEEETRSGMSPRPQPEKTSLAKAVDGFESETCQNAQANDAACRETDCLHQDGFTPTEDSDHPVKRARIKNTFVFFHPVPSELDVI